MSCMNPEEGPCCDLFDLCDQIPDFEIDCETRRALCFREHLVISLKDDFTTDTKPVGGYCICVESIGTQGNEFMIQVLSSMTVNDCFSGSKVISSATEKFHCLEEKRTEYIHKPDGLYEKVLFMGLEDDLYHLEITQLCPCDKFVQREDLPFCCNNKLISEGCNVLLMRYLALKNFHGTLSLECLMIEGQRTTCNYRCSEAQRMRINGCRIDVYTIERRMHEECGLIHNIKTYMTRAGRILRHDWLEVPYLLQINPTVDLRTLETEKVTTRQPLREMWSKDLEMMSKYLDKKTCKMAQHTEYLTDHPELKDMIADYTQNLLVGNQLASRIGFLPNLLRQGFVTLVHPIAHHSALTHDLVSAVKPIDVFEFTIQHFAAFSKHPDPSETSSSEESGIDIMSQLSRYKPRQVCSVCGICFECLMLDKMAPIPEGGRLAKRLRYPPPDPETIFSSCSVFSKCPSDASCIIKVPKGSDITVTCLEDCKACKREGRKCSMCSLYPECAAVCEGCRRLGEPCRIHKACPECPGCHKVCDQIGLCPNCKKCNVEILPVVKEDNCVTQQNDEGGDHETKSENLK